DAPLDRLLGDAAALPSGGPFVDARDPRFLAPASMEAEVRAAAGGEVAAGPAPLVRCILDSLAVATADVVHEIETVTGRAVPELVVVGGGAANTVLNDLIGAATDIPVRVGPTEATAFGNALVQGVTALGAFADLAEARAALR